MYTLHPHQLDMKAATREALRAGYRSVLLQSPTGSGKTVIAASMLGDAMARGKRCCFVVHRRELVKQSVRAFRACGIPTGVISAGFRADLRQPVQVANIGTLVNRVKFVPPFNFIVWDEAHHNVARSWSDTMRAFLNAHHVGLTATPERRDGRGLAEHFQHMVKGPSVRWLIDNGFLCDYRYFSPDLIDTTDIGVRMGDFDRGKSAARIDKPTITGDVVRHWRKLADGKQTIVFACNVEHSRHVVERFCAAGVPAEHIDGGARHHERDAALERFAAGKTMLLSNVDLFGEGFDLPVLEAVILLRPTWSLGLFLQQVGRVLRTSAGKSNAIIIDHVNNLSRHGLPDADREWSLEQKQRVVGKSKTTVLVRVCPKCYAAVPAASTVCIDCAHVFVVEAKQIDEVEGELVEVSKDQARREMYARRSEQSDARGLSELTALGMRRGYKNPRKWAEKIVEAREKKRKGASAMA